MSEIGPDDPVPLKTAARLFFPAGGVSEEMLKREINQGRLVAIKIAGRLFVTRADVEAMDKARLMEGPIAGVYFLRHGCAVKIGFSKDVERRVGVIGEHFPEPPTVLFFVRGTRADELAFHRRFATLRTNREWFALEGELFAFLRSEGCDV